MIAYIFSIFRLLYLSSLWLSPFLGLFADFRFHRIIQFLVNFEQCLKFFKALIREKNQLPVVIILIPKK